MGQALNYIFFDKDGNYANNGGGFDQVSAAALNSFEQLSLSYTPSMEGYLLIYVANQTNENLNVYFDDMTVEHIEGPIVRTDDYYPFGLTFNSSERSGFTTNNFLFNGIERETELDLGWDLAQFRSHDPAIGRWHQIDPKVDNYYSWSPYNSMGNNPINIMDPLGDEWVTKNDKKIADKIRKGLDKANYKLAKRNAKLDGKIAKATEKGNTDKVNSLNSQRNSNVQAIGINNTTKSNLDYMESISKKVPKFTFRQVAGEEGGTQIVRDRIVMEVTNSQGNKMHEVTHGFNLSPKGVRLGEESREVRAYQAQYSADPTSMPPSEATPSTPSSVNGVTGIYVGGIMRTITDKNDKTQKNPVYKQTYKKYKKQYKKTN